MQIQKLSFLSLLYVLYARGAIALKKEEIDVPSFTPTEIKGPVVEQFLGDWESRWKVSNAKRSVNGVEEMSYVGTWAVEESTVFNGLTGELGLVMKDAAAHHAISYDLDEPLEKTEEPLVLQYEVKPQEGLECGGAYIKLLAEPAKGEMSNAVPYRVMFGPDKCGANNKVHFIFNYKNPLTGEVQEKHLSSPPPSNLRKGATSIYTLILNPDQTYQIRVNGQILRSGSLFTDFVPPVLPPRDIPDPEDKKPEDWIDEDEIPDPDAVKPEDWDEDAPARIPDPTAEKPDDWLEDEPLFILDPTAEKPEDWDDEEDGDWEAPSVPNPICQEVSGCGEWRAPLIRNPAFKGPWSPPMIPNPEYKGPWIPRRIPNPDFFDDDHPSHFGPVYGLGFELWTMQPDIRFSNIYLGHSVEDAEKLGNETYIPKADTEHLLSSSEKDNHMSLDEDEAEKLPFKNDLKFTENPVEFVKQRLSLFYNVAMYDWKFAFKTMPEVGGAIVAGLVSALAILVSIISFLTSSPSKRPALNANESKTEKKANKDFQKEKGKDVEVSYAPESETGDSAESKEESK